MAGVMHKLIVFRHHEYATVYSPAANVTQCAILNEDRVLLDLHFDLFRFEVIVKQQRLMQPQLKQEYVSDQKKK